MPYITNVLVVIGLIVGAVFLQIFLSRSESKWPGLVLPFLFFCGSCITVLSVAVSGNTAQDIFLCLLAFLLSNIPTIVFLAIYFAIRKRSKHNPQLDKMNIQDL